MLHAQAQVECRIQTILERHRVKQPGKYTRPRGRLMGQAAALSLGRLT